MIPYPHLKRVTASLRAELRRQLVNAGVDQPPDRASLNVTGAVQTTNRLEHAWFDYRASVEGRGPFDASHT
jgi:hypothetical protein